MKKPWFTIHKIDSTTYCISEEQHPEQTHCYLLLGNSVCLLIDTGLGIGNIYNEVRKLTALPIIAIATHIHWDHIGGLTYFPEFYAHEAELSWLSGEFPLPIESIQRMVGEHCELPSSFDINAYTLFQGKPKRILHGGETLEIGGRRIHVLHTPGHSPGHMCFWEEERSYLFTGDLVYKGMLYANYPSTDPQAYLASLERIAFFPAKRIFPAHHDLDIHPEIVKRMCCALQNLQKENRLHHGVGICAYGDWSIHL